MFGLIGFLEALLTKFKSGLCKMRVAEAWNQAQQNETKEWTKGAVKHNTGM
jgi:hypothetical protein